MAWKYICIKPCCTPTKQLQDSVTCSNSKTDLNIKSTNERKHQDSAATASMSCYTKWFMQPRQSQATLKGQLLISQYLSFIYHCRLILRITCFLFVVSHLLLHLLTDKGTKVLAKKLVQTTFRQGLNGCAMLV